jgi:WD40 repeat protein/serine/threonine protein kinase
MENSKRDITEILSEALALTSAEERTVYLDRVCGDDTITRDEVESLLKMEDGLGDFLEKTVHELDATTECLSVLEGPGTAIGPYRLLERIGEGEMAVVYMAQQEEPIRRQIALKILKLGMDTKRVIARFAAERQALALMDHPNIAKVLDAGSTETGRPYFAMELVNGIPVTRYCTKNKLTIRARLQLFIHVCQAVQHAHQKGLIHRDLKPSNILVTFHDESPVPKVIDFGIAKATEDRFSERTWHTKQPAFVGTPAYMSPEQAQMRVADIDTRTDIYSLGVVLYEMLAHTTPFSARELLKGGIDHCRRVICEVEPERPSVRVAHLAKDQVRVVGKRHRAASGRLVRILRADLDWIVMKCLEKDRGRRYDSVGSLVMDLQRYLTGDPVLARSPSVAYRSWKLIRRYKTAATMVMVLLVAFVVSTWQAVRATWAEQEQGRLRVVAQWAQRDEALQREKAEKERLAVLRQAYNSDMNLTQQALSMHNYGRMVDLLSRHRPQPGRPDLRQWEWRYFWSQCRSEATFVLTPHSNPVRNTTIGPQGRMLVSGDWQGTLRLWNLDDQHLVTTLDVPGINTGVLAFSRDGTRLAYTVNARDRGTRVQLWDIAGERVVGEFTHAHTIRALSFTPEDESLLVLDSRTAVHAWDHEQQILRPQHPGIPERVPDFRMASFSPNSQSVAFVHRQGEISLIDLATGREQTRIHAFDGDIADVVFSPDGKLLAVSPLFTAISTEVKLFSTATGQEQVTLTGHISWVPALAFTPDGQRIVSAGADQTLRIWDVRDGRELTHLHGHLSEIYCVAVSPEGNRIVTGCKDGTLFGWDTERIVHTKQFETLPRPIRSMEFLEEGQALLSVNVDGTVSLWDGTTLQEKATLAALGSQVTQVLMSPDETSVVASTGQGELKILDWPTGQVIRNIVCDPMRSDPVGLAGFMDQGRTLVVVEADAEIRLFDTTSWECKAVWTYPQSRSWSTRMPVVTPDERFLFSVGSNRNIHFVDLHSGEIETLPTHQSWEVLDMAFLPSNRLFAVSTGEGTVSLWSIASRKVTDVLRGHLLGVHAVAFSPDGKRLVSGSKGREAIKFWDMTTRHEVATLPGEGFLSAQLKFSPDGELLGAVNLKGKAQLWRAPSLEEIADAETRAIPSHGS